MVQGRSNLVGDCWTLPRTCEAGPSTSWDELSLCPRFGVTFYNQSQHINSCKNLLEDPDHTSNWYTKHPWNNIFKQVSKLHTRDWILVAAEESRSELEPWTSGPDTLGASSTKGCSNNWAAEGRCAGFRCRHNRTKSFPSFDSTSGMTGSSLLFQILNMAATCPTFSHFSLPMCKHWICTMYEHVANSYIKFHYANKGQIRFSWRRTGWKTYDPWLKARPIYACWYSVSIESHNIDSVLSYPFILVPWRFCSHHLKHSAT